MTINEIIERGLPIYTPWICLSCFLAVFTTIIFVSVCFRKITKTSKNNDSYEESADKVSRMVHSGYRWVRKDNQQYVRDATIKEVLSRQGRWNEAAMVKALKARDRRLNLFIFFFYAVPPIAIGNIAITALIAKYFFAIPFIWFTVLGVVLGVFIFLFRKSLFLYQDCCNVMPEIKYLERPIDIVSSVFTVTAFISSLIAVVSGPKVTSPSVTIVPIVLCLIVMSVCVIILAGYIGKIRLYIKRIKM